MQQFTTVPNQAQRKNALGTLPGLSYRIKKSLEQVIPLFEPMEKPKQGEWLWDHEEEGQTFSAYEGQLHNQVDIKRNVIYIKPLEDIEKSFLSQLKNYCECFFHPMKVQILKTGNLKNITKRINPYSQLDQYHAKQILIDLQKSLKRDAFCLIGVCLTDLYPKQEWNFVFGLASIRQRTGVFSFARYDENFYSGQKYQVNYQKILWRSISVMVHQISHMFGIRHCVYYKCVMNGSNHLEQSDSRPLQLCAVCLRKLQSNIKFDILQRYNKILQFVKKKGDKSGKSLLQFLVIAINKIEGSMKFITK